MEYNITHSISKNFFKGEGGGCLSSILNMAISIINVVRV